MEGFLFFRHSLLACDETDGRLKLRLGPDGLLPCQCCRRIDADCLLMMSLNEAGKSMALGVCGPGDRLISNTLEEAHQDLLPHSPIQAEQWDPTSEEETHFTLDHLRQVSPRCFCSAGFALLRIAC